MRAPFAIRRSRSLSLAPRVALSVATAIAVLTATSCGDDSAPRSSPEAGGSPPARADLGVDAASPDASPPSCGTAADCPVEPDPCVVVLCADGRCLRAIRDQDSDGHPDGSCRPDGLPAGDDCDDLDGRVFPGASERCETELDEDCDPTTAGELDGDGDGYVSAACCNRDRREGDLICGPDCDDASPDVRPGAADGPTACDGLDNDCDGLVDDGCPCPPGVCECEPGATRPCGGGMVNDAPAACRRGTETCGGPTGWGACEGAVGPGLETCNALDDDCDGSVNEEPEASASCSAPSGAVACVEGRCQVVSCPGTSADCDRDASNGCEADTMTSSAHCGGCGMPCDGPCVAGRCDPVVQISAGSFHTCALRTGGSVWCWGMNDNGQLGNGTSGGGTSTNLPAPVVALTDVTHIEAGSLHTCALGTDRRLRCWGSNQVGQLGSGESGMGVLSSVPVEVPLDDLSPFFSAGGSHTCARPASGSLYCWGDNTYGQLGNGLGGSGVLSATPVMGPLVGLTMIAAGVGFNCVGATGMCWGWNEAGELGNDDLGVASSPSPVSVVGLPSLRAIAAGRNHVCGLTATGEVWCWGSNRAGQIGRPASGTGDPHAAPVSGLTGVTQLALGDSTFAGVGYTCARRAGGDVRCWGANTFGQLGSGSMGAGSEIPVEVLGLDDVAEVTAGWGHTCARTALGHVYCWGFNSAGQAGLPPSAAVLTPTRVVL